jgi:hypothetical protein
MAMRWRWPPLLSATDLPGWTSGMSEVTASASSSL